jgi:hypothetical protein
MIDRGSAILIEVEFTRKIPFGGNEYFDPTAPKITVFQTGKVAKLGPVDLTQSTLGKYYYVAQTLTNWDTGSYNAKITASDETYSDITKDKVFILK